MIHALAQGCGEVGLIVLDKRILVTSDIENTFVHTLVLVDCDLVISLLLIYLRRALIPLTALGSFCGQ